MNTKTTIREADLEAADERLKAAVLRDLTPQELADRLLVATYDDGQELELEGAFRTLMKAAGRLLHKRALNGRTEEQLSDDECDNLPMSADPRIIIRALVDDYGVEDICEWLKEAVKDEDLLNETLARLAAGEAAGDDE